MARPRGTDSAQVIQVIKTESLRGEGTQEDLCRIVTQYWDFDGNLLAENDPCITECVIQGMIDHVLNLNLLKKNFHISFKQFKVMLWIFTFIVSVVVT